MAGRERRSVHSRSGDADRAAGTGGNIGTPASACALAVAPAPDPSEERACGRDAQDVPNGVRGPLYARRTLRGSGRTRRATLPVPTTARLPHSAPGRRPTKDHCPDASARCGTRCRLHSAPRSGARRLLIPDLEADVVPERRSLRDHGEGGYRRSTRVGVLGGSEALAGTIAAIQRRRSRVTLIRAMLSGKFTVPIRDQSFIASYE